MFGPLFKIFASLLFLAGTVYHVFSPYHFFTPVETAIPEKYAFPFAEEHPIERPPLQEDLPGPRQSYSFDRFSFEPVAAFHVRARVLGKRAYRWDRMSAYCPVDLALGWGPMSLPKIIDQFSIRQSNRFYFWSTREFPIPRSAVESNSANMHLVPANREVAQALFFVREDDIVDFTGYLINITRDDGHRWNTSTTRHDTGGGACEIVLVTRLQRNP